MSIKVSVVIPCFNGDKYLQYTIESVLNQTRTVNEIIVVDDGSSDSTKQIATSFPDVTYLYHENKGVSFSRNRGFRESVGEYVVFLDADDLLPRNRIEDDCRFLDKHSDIGYVFGWFDVIDQNGDIKDRTHGENIVEAGYHTILEGKATVPPGAVTFRSKNLRQLNDVFDVNVRAAEDFDLYLRFSRLFPIYCLNHTALLYRRHQNNFSSYNGGIDTLKSMLLRLDAQEEYVTKHAHLLRSLRDGRSHWKELLGPRCVGQLVMAFKAKEWKIGYRVFIFLVKYCPYIFMKSIFQRVLKRL